MIICALYDVKSDTILTPIYTFVNEQVARRSFTLTCDQFNRIGLGVVGDNPDDFFLVQLAHLDQLKEGVITEDHKRLFCLNEVVKNG